MANTRYQEGSLKKVKSKQGMAWKLRYFANRTTDGKWTEQTPLWVGLVADFPTEKRARVEAVRLGLIEQINRTSVPVKMVTFGFIARDYVRINLADSAIKPKASTSRYTERLIIRKHLLPRWEHQVAIEMKPLAIEQWLKEVSIDTLGEQGQQWDSLTKWRRIMKDIFLHAQKHELISEGCNPLEKVRVKASSSGFVPIILTPKETFAIFNHLPLLQQTMVLLDAATGLRYSEIAGLQWRDVDWENKRIQIERRWIRGDVDSPKTKGSKAPVVLSDVLAAYLMAWRRETKYAKETDWVFASDKNKGTTPRVGNMLVRSYLYPAAVKTGVLKETTLRMKKHGKEGGQEGEIEKKIYFDKKGERVRRFGFHQFRHSLSSFLTTKKKVDPKTAQTALRQSNAAFTLNRYTQTDSDELLAAQNLMLDAIFEPGTEILQ
ncbi:MAG TPA: site-specific integrase [Terriglobia bacterium]|nr:site-specific integrase [Terriglobia bacterium]